MTADAIRTAARLGVVIDLQPVWLYLDSRTLLRQFGAERLRWFQPLRSLAENGVVAGGGSDHMMKRGDLRSINPYNPFLGMWTAIVRRGRWHDETVEAGEALTREQAIRFYTRSNAHLLFWENEIGSLEAGKRADFIVIDRDLLACPVDDIRTTRVLETWIEGRRVYELR
jgi:predicted amidohydrolase YtcJ